MKKRLIAIALALILVAAGACGAFFAVRYYKYRQSSAFAYEQLTAAFGPPADLVAIARMVDFQTISEELAAETAKAFPFFLKGPEQEREISKIVQNHALRVLKIKSDAKADEPKGSPGEPLTPEKELELRLKAPLFVLPNDFLEQIHKTVTMWPEGESTAILKAEVVHPLLSKKFTLVFTMIRRGDAWIVRDINAKELVSTFRTAMIDRLERRRTWQYQKNADTMKRMNETLTMQSCTAEAGLLADGKSMMLVVDVLARNGGGRTVLNTNVDATITDKDGNELLKRHLNAVKTTGPGEDFLHRWAIELDANTSPGKQLLAAKQLICKAVWHNMTLQPDPAAGKEGNRRLFLNVEPLPDTLSPCRLVGHDHPEGICQSAIFHESSSKGKDNAAHSATEAKAK